IPIRFASFKNRGLSLRFLIAGAVNQNRIRADFFEPGMQLMVSRRAATQTASGKSGADQSLIDKLPSRSLNHKITPP
ncbi:MAG: hypothetical protein ACFB22_01150, partial [Rhodothalassiaceae bacterium]